MANIKVHVFMIITAGLITGGSPIDIPQGQPDQIASNVTYGGSFKDTFFTTDNWSYPWWIIRHEDGHIENTLGGPTDGKELHKRRQTARCTSTLQYDHAVVFCEATVKDDGTLQLYIHDESASTRDCLSVRVRNGSFTSQYWTSYAADKGDERLVWTTRKQKLSLDRKTYKKGDTIKGAIDFECIQEVTNPGYGGRNPTGIGISGLVKPVVE